jgi:hypothetical protein
MGGGGISSFSYGFAILFRKSAHFSDSARDRMWAGHCIAGYSLSRVIHRISNPNFFGNSDWHIEWLGTIDRPGPARYTGLRTPPFLWQPPPPPPSGT